jgi:crotonobetainyl-CoA:carnitine CoA-transferase CaiB-like acyl-CoA transferase
VETSLVRAAGIEQAAYLLDHAGRGSTEPRGPEATGWQPLQRIYAVADGWLFLGARRDQMAVVAGALGVDQQLDGLPDDDVEQLLAAALAPASCEDAVTVLQRAGVGAHRVDSLQGATAPDGMLARRGLRLEDDTPERGRIVMPGPIVHLSRTPMEPGSLPTPLGPELP